MKQNQVAAILYTVRDFLNSRGEVESTLQRLKEIGFPAVEICGIEESLYPAAELGKTCASLGLEVTSAHHNWNDIIDQPRLIAERTLALGTNLACYPYPGDRDMTDPTAVDSLIKALEKAAAVMADAGVTLCFHHHALEFLKIGGRRILDRIFEETRLAAELDTYWIQLGGGYAPDWLHRLSGRVPLLHLKDVGVEGNGPRFAEIGAGNLNFPEIVKAADTAGVRWFIVEQDECFGRDPFDCLSDSLAFIRNHLVSG